MLTFPDLMVSSLSMVPSSVPLGSGSDLTHTLTSPMGSIPTMQNMNMDMDIHNAAFSLVPLCRASDCGQEKE